MTGSPRAGHDGLRCRLGNLGLIAFLLVLAVAAGASQNTEVAWPSPGSARWLGALALVASYLAACTVSLRRRAMHSSASAIPGAVSVSNATPDDLVVAYASQTGHARQLAVRTLEALRAGGLNVRLCPIGELDATRLQRIRRILILASTTGEGDAPDMAAGFVGSTLGSGLRLDHLQYGLLALGDSEYRNFCAFGHAIDTWLQHVGARPMFDLIEVDDGDPGALRHWQYRLGQLSGRSDLPDWQVPEYSRCVLLERELVNPGSAGDPCFRIVLGPADLPLPHWHAGDVAEIGPQNPPAQVEAWLDRHGLDGDAAIVVQGKPGTLRTHAASCALDDPAAGADAQALAEVLTRLPHRDYSIASIPSDGRIELLLRQWRRADGSLGLGTGWLTRHAGLGETVSLRIRSNVAFHAPAADVPLLLIGNGTGIASLRALIRQRIAEGRLRNWLIFGERNADRDFHFRDEILGWQADASLVRLDLAFSRDQAEPVYVQHRLLAASANVREWVEAGAEILVCGSLQGMAPGVDQALHDILGETRLLELAAAGRYRRDVY
jgi:sulfite reductase (NADPH) flavoprotein alpha-component